MTFDAKKIFAGFQQELLSIITGENYWDKLLNWVELKHRSGLSKKEIYEVLLVLIDDIHTRPDPGEVLYDKVADFLDGFTAWGKSFRILPDEPDIK